MEEKVYRRKLEEKIMKFGNRREIIGIRGPRQAGKTTLLRAIEKNVGGTKAFINLDRIEYRKTLEENPLDFARRFRKEGRLSLFLDEIQRVKDAGEKLKIIYDELQGVKMFVSGSSSLELKANVLPPLVGRMLLFELFTFDFEEFLMARDEGLHRVFREKNGSLYGFLAGKDDVAEPSFSAESLRHLKEYLIFGGYPEVIKSLDEEEKMTVLRNIFNLYLEKDITSIFQIEEVSEFDDFLKSLAFNISGIFSLSSLASDAKITYKTAEKFLSILRHTYVIFLLKPFYRNLSTEIKKSPKAYFWDLGLRNSVTNDFSPFDNRSDKGKLLENFVAREMFSNLPDHKINYWRTAGKAEMDFVITRGEEIIPIEVKLSGSSLGKGFHSFLNTYKPEKAVIVTLDTFGRQKIGKTTVYRIPSFYL